MAKPEWGTKRRCTSCGAPFYDLLREPITCPKCDSVFTPEAPPKPRRGSTSKTVKRVMKVVVPPAVVDVTDDGDKDTLVKSDAKNDLAETETDDDDEGGDIIEDPSELGEDEDDMAEVIDGAAKKDDER